MKQPTITFKKLQMKQPTISFATSVWNEHEEIDRLLNQLLSILGPDDEIVVQGDQGKVTSSVVSVLHRFIKNPQIKYIEYPLRKNFAAYKNNLFRNCEKEYIFNIDSDELLTDTLANNFRQVLLENSDVDMFRLPRINIVEGITAEYVSKWHWNVNTDNWINFPDYQCRIVKNGTSAWKNSVHEVLAGYSSTSDFPAEAFWSLVHVKSIDRQIKQNDFYSTF